MLPFHGLIGGMSWESTVTYYEQINQLVNQRLGGLHSAKILLASVDFDEIEKLQSQNEWEKSGQILGEVAKSLEKAGAEFFLICTNTMHKVADQVQEAVTIPMLHIADATIKELNQNKITKVGLLGTKYTMQQDFYKQRILASNIEVLVPESEDIEKINQVIFNELVLGEITPESKQEYQIIIEKLIAAGAQGIILGCTEIGLLIQQDDVTIPIFDTTVIHSKAAVDYALNDSEQLN